MKSFAAPGFSTSLLLSTVLYCPTFVSAQTSFLYKWAFQDTSIQTTIPTCTRLPIVITSFDTTTNSTRGSPPYYMIAFPDGGTPTTTLIGTSEQDASYTVLHPVGTRILLSVVDSDGNPGGTFAPQMVIAGSNEDCVVNPANTFTMVSNVTSELSTCEQLGIGISGGTAPYQISLVAANAPSVTNDTLGAGHNVYTYVNRAAPGGQLLAAISDADGRWASGSVLLSTKGSTDTSCPGLLSSSGQGTITPPPSPSSSAGVSGQSSSTGNPGSSASQTSTSPPSSSQTDGIGNDGQNSNQTGGSQLGKNTNVVMGAIVWLLVGAVLPLL